MSSGLDIGGKKDINLLEAAFPSNLSEIFFGEPDAGVQAPQVVESKDLPIISSDASTEKQKRVYKKSGRRQTLIARENMLGVGNTKKKSVLG